MSHSRARRVLFFEGAEDGTTGGSHQAMFDLIRHLDRERFEPIAAFSEDNRYAAAIRELGISVHVLQAEREMERHANESANRARQAWTAAAAAFRRLRVLRRESVDLLHLNNSPLLGMDDWLPAALALGIPCLANSMGRPYDRPRGPVRGALSARVRCIRAISAHVAAELRTGGWSEERIRTVPLSVDAEAFRRRVTLGADEVRAALGIPRERVWITMVGNIREWKGQEVVVEALAQLPAEVRGRVALSFVGATAPSDRAYHARVEQAIARTGLGQHVSLLGSRTDVPNLMAGCDVVVHASTLPEPFGLVVVEGMILGKAVIAAGSGGPAEVITQGSGLLFETGNAADLARKLAGVVADPELRARFGAAARSRAGAFSIEREAAAVQSIYDQILADAT